MLSLTHAVVGSALGEQISNPVVAFSVGVLAHFITDKIPHFWPKEKKYKRVIMAFDAIFTVGFILFCYFYFNDRLNIAAGALGGGIVDALLVLTPLYHTKLGQWHSNRQPHKTEIFYYLTDFIQIALALSFLFLI
jgi:uncharacterized membrane protein YagU involved in acid resistance